MNGKALIAAACMLALGGATAAWSQTVAIDRASSPPADAVACRAWRWPW